MSRLYRFSNASYATMFASATTPMRYLRGEVVFCPGNTANPWGVRVTTSEEVDAAQAADLFHDPRD